MLIRFDRVATAAVSALALSETARATCYNDAKWFKSLANDTYSVTQCGYSHKLDHMVDAFVAHCNATRVGYQYSTFWHTVKRWYPITLQRKQHDADDSDFVACLNAHHNAAPRGMNVATGAVLLSAGMFAYALAG